MRINRELTAMLLLAAFGTVGCSSGKAPEATPPQPAGTAHAKPIAVPHVVEQKEEQGTTGVVPPKAAGPVSFDEAAAAYEAKNYSEATKLFGEYAERRPKNAWGHFMLGLSASKAGDLAMAESAFEQALAIDPNHTKTLVNLSRVLIDQGRLDDAIVRLTHAAELVPDSADVQRLLGRAYAGQRRTHEAVDAYSHAIALDARDAWSMNNLGLLLLEQGRADEALPPLSKAAELRKDVPAFHNNLGMALEHTGRFKAAAAAYRDALAADAGYVKAQQNLARVEAVKSDR